MHARNCVCLYAEKWRKHSLMFECGCVSLLACICVFVKDTVYVKGKKKHCSLALILHFKSRQAEDRESFMKTD